MKLYEELTFTDDFMFSKVLYTNLDLCEELLSLILGKSVTILDSPEIEKNVWIRYDSHGVRFDVYVKDEDNKIYDIEMQVEKEKNLPLRSRYYHGMLDMDQLERGVSYDCLKESYVIFICKDTIGREYKDVVYTYRNECAEHPGLLLNDKSYTIILNAQGDLSKLSLKMKEFIQYIRTGIVSGEPESFVDRIEHAVITSRAHKKWRVEYMTLEMKIQEGCKKVAEQVTKQVTEQVRKEDYQAFAAEREAFATEREAFAAERETVWNRLVAELGEEKALTIMPKPCS